MESEGVVGRRGMLKAGAAVAGVAAGAAIASVASAPRADAADGEAVLVGGDYTSAGNATTFQITGSSTVPAVGLRNDQGPSLFLAPLPDGVDVDLATGQIANTADGPLIGVSAEQGGSVTTYLATGFDLAVLPVPVAVSPLRVLDTRSAAGRERIVRKSSDLAIDSSGRLTRGRWIDVAIDSAAGEFTLEAAFLNVTVTGSLAGGFVLAYPPGARPNASTVNFSKGQTIANGTFVALGVFEDSFVVRLYANATTHLVVDLNGASVTDVPGPAAPAAQDRRAARQTPAVSRKAKTLRRAALRR